jgi:hypothetical protein
MNWYDELDCSRCGKPLKATRHQGRPLLRSAAGATVEPHRRSEAEIATLRETHLPVCWGCNLESAFQPAPGKAAPPAKKLDWWVGTPCDACGTPLRRNRFWQERPRAVDENLGSFDVRSVDPHDCSDPAKRYVVACVDCYYNHYDRVSRTARNRSEARRQAPESSSPPAHVVPVPTSGGTPPPARRP